MLIMQKCQTFAGWAFLNYEYSNTFMFWAVFQYFLTFNRLDNEQIDQKSDWQINS